MLAVFCRNREEERRREGVSPPLAAATIVPTGEKREETEKRLPRSFNDCSSRRVTGGFRRQHLDGKEKEKKRGGKPPAGGPSSATRLAELPVADATSRRSKERKREGW
ncbi:hypothetical protein AABB24_034143 [Solanum stoloniferum]|uniref:Uncharacterized protein n=1 Tax=Solanum stoloniferum TaxID=62892 RepID=A0ABD2RFA3_9SOLN